MSEIKEPEETWVDEKELVLPDHSEEEINTLARDLFHGKIFTSNHCRDPEDLKHVFMIIALGAFADYKKESLDKVGMVYEYLDKAGPRSVNGYPMFMSMQLLNRSDTTKVFDKYNRLKAAEEAALRA